MECCNASKVVTRSSRVFAGIIEGVVSRSNLFLGESLTSACHGRRRGAATNVYSGLVYWQGVALAQATLVGLGARAIHPLTSQVQGC